MKQFYIHTHYTTERDSWPPEQPKQFTTLVLLQHRGQPSQEHIITIEKAAAAGDISSIVSAANEHKCVYCNYDGKLNESLQQSRATKNVTEVLNILENPEINPRTLLIEGTPGIGKTFLLRHIAFEWAHNRMLRSSQFVFLLCLRDPAVRELSSIRGLVNYFYKKDSSARKLAKRISEHLSSSDGRSVTFLLDGYDELPQQLQSDSFVAEILNHQVLPASGVIVTSRPHATAYLHDKVACLIKILGFTEKDRTHYIEQSLPGQPEKIAEVVDYLDMQPTISSLCFIPYHLTVLMFLYKKGYILPKTSTELYKYFICVTIRRYLSKHKKKEKFTDLNDLPMPYCEIIEQLAAFSFKAIGTKQVTFTLEELQTACPEINSVPEGINGLGLLQAVQHFGYTDTTTTVNFLHLTIQEYLAAYYVAFLTPDEELLVLHEKFYDDKYENTFLIYVGLTKGQNRAFKHFLSGGGRYFGTGSQLLNRLFSDDRPPDNNAICDRFLGLGFNSDFSFHLFRCLYEAGDKSWYNQVVDSCLSMDIDLNDQILSFSSVETIGLMLTCKPEWSSLYINPGYPSGETHIKLLHKPLVTHSPIVNSIRFYGGNFCVDPIFGNFCADSTGIDLSNDGFSIPCQLLLANIVTACQTKVLHVEYYNVDNPVWMEKVLTHRSSMLQELHLQCASITPTTACKLFSII